MKMKTMVIIALLLGLVLAPMFAQGTKDEAAPQEIRVLLANHPYGE